MSAANWRRLEAVPLAELVQSLADNITVLKGATFLASQHWRDLSDATRDEVLDMLDRRVHTLDALLERMRAHPGVVLDLTDRDRS